MAKVPKRVWRESTDSQSNSQYKILNISTFLDGGVQIGHLHVAWGRGGGGLHQGRTRRRAVAVGLEVLAHLLHHLGVDGLGHVLPQQVDNEEVAQVALADQRGDVVGVVDRLVFALDDRLPDGRHQDDGGAQHHGDGRRHCQDDEPEPQEDVDLLVQDVQRQNAQRVVTLDGP